MWSPGLLFWCVQRKFSTNIVGFLFLSEDVFGAPGLKVLGLLFRNTGMPPKGANSSLWVSGAHCGLLRSTESNHATA